MPGHFHEAQDSCWTLFHVSVSQEIKEIIKKLRRFFNKKFEEKLPWWKEIRPIIQYAQRHWYGSVLRIFWLVLLMLTSCWPKRCQGHCRANQDLLGFDWLGEQLGVNRWTWLEDFPMNKRPLPKKVTPQKIPWAKPAKCTYFAYQHHPKTTSSPLWTRDVVKIMPWLQLTDNSSQSGLCVLIKSQKTLGRTNENMNSGIFSTASVYIFLSLGIYPVLPPHHPLCVAPRAINPVLKTAISFTT